MRLQEAGLKAYNIYSETECPTSSHALMWKIMYIYCGDKRKTTTMSNSGNLIVVLKMTKDNLDDGNKL